ncbi:DUF2501 domain-containing protein [Castellaniella sp.]|uniref:DUF2501 domain-containing protein n=1 Tax=Castellaniella sp. TaxID=1955812 RepID=UPI002AFF034B|nr:DUF2501 domain-containing protein [Castellaniella sp.]
MYKTLCSTVLASACLLAFAAPAGAAGIADLVKDQAIGSLGGGTSSSAASGLGSVGSALGLPSIGGGTASNVAGILQYCVQKKYLGGTSAASVKDKLLEQAGVTQKKPDTGYQQGLSGLLSGSDGSSFDMNKLTGDLKNKACDYVLDNASSLI